MNRRILLASGLGAFCIAGCTPGALWHIFSGDGKQQAENPLTPIEGRKNIKVLVLATSGPTVAQSYDFAGLDRDIASKFTKKLVESTKESKHPLVAISPSAFDKFKANTPGWKVTHPSQIAKQLGADYVIDVQIAAFRVYDPETGKNMYQGAARMEVTVYAAGVEDVKYRYTIESKQPDEPAYVSDVSAYRTKFVDQIVLELAAKHTEHTSDSRVAPLRQ